MNLQDFNQILVVTLLIVLIIGIAILVIQISRTLKTLNMIFEDTHNVTVKISDLTDHPEKFQIAAEKYVNESIENIVNQQAYKLRKSIAQDLIGGIVNYLRKAN